MIGGRALRKQVLPLFFLVLVSFNSVHSIAANFSWTEIADFLSEEEDSEGLAQLEEKALVERPQDIELIKRILGFHLRTQNRKALLQTMNTFAHQNKCDGVKSFRQNKAVCEPLFEVWVDHLDSVFFFNDSDRKLELARRMLLSQDCSGAATVLKELESKEGFSKRILVLREKTWTCLGDSDAAAKTAAQIQEMRIFARGDDI